MPSFDVFNCLSTFSWSRWEARLPVQLKRRFFSFMSFFWPFCFFLSTTLCRWPKISMFSISLGIWENHTRENHTRENHTHDWSCKTEQIFYDLVTWWSCVILCGCVILITARADVMLKVGRISVDFSRFHFIHDTCWWAGLKLGIHWHVTITGSLRRVVFYFFWECYYVDFLFK